MQDGEICVLVILRIRTPEAHPHREPDPESQHRDQRKTHRRFVNQKLDSASSQKNPAIRVVEVLDPFGFGFHASEYITVRGEEKKFSAVMQLETGSYQGRLEARHEASRTRHITPRIVRVQPGTANLPRPTWRGRPAL